MPDIRSPLQLSASALRQIAAVVQTGPADYKLWGAPEFEIVRKEIRAHYRAQQGGLCAYCRAPLSLSSPLNCHVEHIVPKSLYPQFLLEPVNLCVICADCNTIKREQETTNQVPDPLKRSQLKRYPRISTAFLIVHPHFDSYTDHIQILGGRYYIDKSKKGHFTIGACRLNRHLWEFGWEPCLIEMPEIEAAIDDFYESRQPLERMSALTRLKSLLSAA